MRVLQPHKEYFTRCFVNTLTANVPALCGPELWRQQDSQAAHEAGGQDSSTDTPSPAASQQEPPAFGWMWQGPALSGSLASLAGSLGPDPLAHCLQRSRRRSRGRWRLRAPPPRAGTARPGIWGPPERRASSCPRPRPHPPRGGTRPAPTAAWSTALGLGGLDCFERE